jgi:hypothetical protein
MRRSGIRARQLQINPIITGATILSMQEAKPWSLVYKRMCSVHISVYEVNSNRNLYFIYIYKTEQVRRKLLFIFSLLGVSRFGRTFRWALCMARRLCELFFEGTPHRSSPPPPLLLELLRSYYFTCQLPVLLGKR